MEGWVDLVDLIAPRPGVEPVTFRSRVQHSTNATAKTTNYIGIGPLPSLSGYFLLHENYLRKGFGRKEFLPSNSEKMAALSRTKSHLSAFLSAISLRRQICYRMYCTSKFQIIFYTCNMRIQRVCPFNKFCWRKFAAVWRKIVTSCRLPTSFNPYTPLCTTATKLYDYSTELRLNWIAGLWDKKKLADKSCISPMFLDFAPQTIYSFLCHIFQSRIFHPLQVCATFSNPAFSCLAFSASPSLHVTRFIHGHFIMRSSDIHFT